VVEEDAVAGVDAIGLAVVHRDPVGVELGHGIRASRVKRGRLFLGDFLHKAEEFAGARLVEAGFLFEPEEADGLQKAEGSQGIDIGGVLRGLEAHRDMALRAEVIDLVGLQILQDAREVCGIGQIAVVHPETGIPDMRIPVDMIDALRVEERRPPLDAVDLVPLCQQKFGKVGAILPGDACDERFFH